MAAVDRRLGIDIGSTTVKLAMLEDGKMCYSDYARHFSNINDTLKSVFEKAMDKLGDEPFSARITGSGGLTIARRMGLRFVQEVEAVATALSSLQNPCDVAIEIGGEDAKIIYLQNGIDQRMNGICAGGTGAFIDQMAALLMTDADGLNELAKNYKVIYPIAARCGVFAKSDLQPLINEGAAKEDLAASIFQAVVSQTISGLACGRPIRGRVAFLGGPLHFTSELKKRFIEVLKLEPEDVISPEQAHLFAVIGSALSADRAAGEQNEFRFSSLMKSLRDNTHASHEIARLSPLFESEEEHAAFTKRHKKAELKKRDLAGYEGNSFLGIDAGSTTAKLALISEQGELLYSFYAANQGKPVNVIAKALTELYAKLPKNVNIVNSCVTGYGEGLIKAALNVDIGEIETMAHYKAASFFQPKVDFILDIGGQDMKCMRLRGGVIDDVLLNEACSAGCGSFIETFAKSLGYSAKDFAALALESKNPIDLGTRCTVFINSRVKQAQKEGAAVSDISAGLAYSVIKNALHKVIKVTDPKELGEYIVVQGGTFYNDAVLRSFELISGREAVRPDIAGIMGAFGAAVIAKDRFEPGHITSLSGLSEIESLEVASSMSRCKGCENNCLLTINRFSSKKGSGSSKSFISGNRCERGLGREKANKDIPNLFDYKYKRLFEAESLPPEKAPRGTVGIPRVLNMYENYPLWHAFFTKLGYRVVLSPRSTRSLYEGGMESMPSESVCYPAKLTHGHIMSLIKSGVRFIFYPSVAYERREFHKSDNNYNCPIVTSYPENIKNNVEEIREMGLDFRNPFLNLNDKRSLGLKLCEVFKDIPEREILAALDAGWKEQSAFSRDMEQAGRDALQYIRANKIKGVILAGRPYHCDPEINHGIADMITGYGAAVLTEDSVARLAAEDSEHAPNVMDQWAYHSRLYAAARFAAADPQLELVQLNSFGCGLDAVTSDAVRDILDRKNRIYTLIKIDEVNNLGSARIRVRSLFAALNEKRGETGVREERKALVRIPFTKSMKKRHTILGPQLSPIHFDFVQKVFRKSGYNLVVLPAIDKEAIDIGLRYVNNDACYPALIAVGQIIRALRSGKYDLENTSCIISQTGGGCRASNYINFIRRALYKAGYTKIPVVSLSMGGMEKNPGFKPNIAMLNRALQALSYGDLLMRVLYRTRPYEQTPGSANALYEFWKQACLRSLEKASLREYRANIALIVKDFDELKLKDVRKPRVGVVGEILVKFHPTANNDVVGLLEQEGAEAVVPDFTNFFLYSFFNANYKVSQFGAKRASAFVPNIAVKIIEMYREPMRKALLKSRRFSPSPDIDELAKFASPIASLGNQTGEGWFLTAEMVELIHDGVPNIICTQPFACLPNHVTGKGMIKELKRRFPEANIVAIDYDPGASEVNQLNRIKLMLSAANRKMKEQMID